MVGWCFGNYPGEFTVLKAAIFLVASSLIYTQSMVVRERNEHLVKDAFGIEVLSEARSIRQFTPRSFEMIMVSFFVNRNCEYFKGFLFGYRSLISDTLMK